MKGKKTSPKNLSAALAATAFQRKQIKNANNFNGKPWRLELKLST